MGKKICSLDAHVGRDAGRLVRIRFCFKDGSEETRMVFPEDFLQMFRAGVFQEHEERHEFFDVGPVPRGYAGAAVDRFSSSLKVALRVPAGVRPYNYFGTTHVVPQPEALVLIRADKGVFGEMYIFAVSGEVLCNYPTANVHENGLVCWGSNPRPEILKIADAERVLPIFYGSEFNNDLYSAGRTVCKKAEFTNPEGLLRALEGRTEFPVEWLVPLGETVESKVRNFLA